MILAVVGNSVMAEHGAKRVKVDFNTDVVFVKHGDIAAAFSIELLTNMCGCTFEKRGDETIVHFADAAQQKKESEQVCRQHFT